MTTKEQERKALAQIRKIVEGLGADSYIATAFEGCFEIAESNIENDWACSMKQRAECAEEAASKMEVENINLRYAIKKAKEEAHQKQTELEEQIEKLNRRCLSLDDLCDCRSLVDNAGYEAEQEKTEAAKEIIRLAESADSEEFKEAVRGHRAAKSRWEYLNALRIRIEKAEGIH